MNHSISNLLRAPLIPKMASYVATSTSCDIHFVLVTVATLRALPHQLTVTVFVDGADSAVKFAGALPTLTAAISGVLSVMQMSGKLKNGAGKVNMPSYICCV